MEDFLTQKDFEIQKELGCRISMYLGKILWQRKNVFYMIFYSVGWFDTIGKFSILREYVLKMDLMHSGNLIILYTMYRCIPSYGAHCPSRNTPQRDLRKRGDWIWGDLVAHSVDLADLAFRKACVSRDDGMSKIIFLGGGRWESVGHCFFLFSFLYRQTSSPVRIVL